MAALNVRMIYLQLAKAFQPVLQVLPPPAPFLLGPPSALVLLGAPHLDVNPIQDL